MRDPFPTQGRYRGMLEADLIVREERRTSAHRIVHSDQPVVGKTARVVNAAGNEKVLRAIPVSIEGVAGVIPGTCPGSGEHLYWMDRHGSVRS
jgi:hypothetical protein